MAQVSFITYVFRSTFQLQKEKQIEASLCFRYVANADTLLQEKCNAVIPRLTLLLNYDFWSQTQYIKPSSRIASTSLKIYKSCRKSVTRTSCSTTKFRSKGPLKNLRNPSLSLGRGPWSFRIWLRDVKSLKLASKCLRHRFEIGNSSIQTRNYGLRACCEGILRMKSLPRQTSLLNLFKSCLRTSSSSAVLLDTGYADRIDPPTA